MGSMAVYGAHKRGLTGELQGVLTFTLVRPQDSAHGEHGRMERMVKAAGSSSSSKHIWMSSPSCRMSVKQVGCWACVDTYVIWNIWISSL